MNFLKSGTIDEAPMMLLFLLASLYMLGKFMRNQDKFAFMIICGILMGLSTMTRYTTLPVAAGILLFISTSRAINKKSKSIILFLFPYILVLSPWILRNYLIYGEPVLSVGSGRVLLFTQTEEFIGSFPNKTVDEIERDYLRTFHKSHTHLSQLDEFSLDKEFKRYAISEAINSPWKYLRSLVVKLKVFLPYRYYPQENSIVKDIAYVLPYLLSILFFLWSILRSKRLTLENISLLIALVGLVIPGLVYFMLSRHLYPLITFMIIFSCITHSNAIHFRPLTAD
jgi:4-amino-4-deoxy-L-arabinose transferase-like glycosyltransferase